MDKKKISDFLEKVFGWLIYIVLIAGGLAAIGFIISLIIGGGEGGSGQQLADFLRKEYFPKVILLATITIFIGLLQMYITGTEALSIKSDKKEAEEELTQIKQEGAPS